ncbi:MAG: polymerase, sigma 28 subunit, FliA/WhiG subfamily [Herbinix sp.]|jgi:RNA polymerase sigma factor|nr:polymerase, sigma 28 subunit, FliA/WhiG subfamily [Herbinix sp.]
MRELDTLALEAKENPDKLDSLIRQLEHYILKCASRTCHRFITRSDDEWSIALMAFTQAVDNYNLDKGSFLSFVDLVIKRRLIDYIKGQAKYSSEVSIDPILFDTEPDEESEDASLRMAVAEQVVKLDSGDLKLEIETANMTFSAYGFSFFELSECSPHAAKTKKSCAIVINYMLQHDLLLSDLRSTRQLPLKIIENNTHVPRKIMERHRKYIIAAIEILSGEYPYLADYLRYIREER